MYANLKDKTFMDLLAKSQQGLDPDNKGINDFLMKREMGDCKSRGGVGGWMGGWVGWMDVGNKGINDFSMKREMGDCK